MSNGKSDDDVVVESAGSMASYAIPRLVQGEPKPLHYIDPDLIPKTKSNINYEWAEATFDSFHIFDDAQNIQGRKVQIAQRTEKCVHQWRLMAEVIHDSLYNSGKQAAEDEIVKRANARHITTPEKQRITSADDVFKSFQQEEMIALFRDDKSENKVGEKKYFSHGFVIVREMFLNHNSSWAAKAVQQFMDDYSVTFDWNNSKLRRSFALKIVMSCSGYYQKRLIKVQLRAVGAYWCERMCKRSGKKINNETWTEFRLPEQTTFGTCTSGYKVVGGTNDEVSTLTDEKTVSESLRDLCRQASLTGLEREVMMTMVGEAWDHGKLISSALQF